MQGPGEETYRELLDRRGRAVRLRRRGRSSCSDPAAGLVDGWSSGPRRARISPSWNPADPGRAPERLPLSVGNRTLGLIVLDGRTPDAGRRGGAACCAPSATSSRWSSSATGCCGRRPTREILRQTETARRNMLAAVSHDLRSPLAAIKASVTDLLDPDVARIEMRTRRRSCASSTRRPIGSTRSSRTSSTCRGSKRASCRRASRSVDLAEAVTAEVDAAAVRWPDVTIDASIDERHATATADPVFLPRVLSNLLDNAARAASRGRRAHGRGCRRASATSASASASWTTARGWTRPRGRSCSSRSTRLDERTTKLGPGLGLAIAKGFVDLMGGEPLARGHAGRRRDVRVLAARRPR